MNSKEHDSVEHPQCYTQGIECIDFIESKGLGEGFCAGNAIKYIVRYKHKNKDKEGRIEDLRKAIWYIERLIKEEEKKDE